MTEQVDIGRPLTAIEQTDLIDLGFVNGDKPWVVNESNHLAAISALSFTQPKELYFITTDASPKDTILGAIASRIGPGCMINLRFVDSFLQPSDTRIDQARLKYIFSNQSLTLVRFYGYLDMTAIAAIAALEPKNLVTLGLAIQNATDAATIDGLTLELFGENFQHLNVAVSSSVAFGNLKPLHSSFEGKHVYLTFPYLTDEFVNGVRVAIDNLATGRNVQGLYFPKSQLTAGGTWHLAFSLRDLAARGVGIEHCGTWKPDQRDKAALNEMFKTAKSVEEGVNWNVDWLYKASVHSTS